MQKLGKHLITEMMEYSKITNINTMNANYTKIKSKDMKILMDFFEVDDWDYLIKQVTREVKIKKIIDDRQR